MNKITFLYCIAISMLLLSCGSEKKEAKPDTYKVVSPVITDTVATNEYVAEINALQNVEVRSHIKGFMEKIWVDEGQAVKQGQIIFTISSKEYQQELQRAKAELKNAKAELKSAQIELDEAQKLFSKNIIGKPEYDLASAKVETLIAKVEVAESNEAKARFNLSFAEVKAPFDGIINRIPNKIGSLIQEETLLTTISNINEVFAYFNVSEKDYLDYTLNKNSELAEVSLILANGNIYAHKGKVDAVESEFDASTGNIAFRARFPNPDKLLKHGGNGKIVKTKVLKNAMIIPKKSTFELQDLFYVFVVKKDGTIEQRNIKIKMRFTNLFVIESGLTKDEVILYEGVQNVKAGDKILYEKK